MKLAYVGLWSPQNVKYWSGTPYFSYRALKNGQHEIELIDTPKLDKFLFYAGKISRKFGLDLLREPLIRKAYGYLVNRKIAVVRPDVIISVGASHKLCDLEADCRIVHIADALFASIVSSYSHLSGMSERSLRLGEAIQKRFLERVDALCLSSDWAVESAQEHYDLAHCRVRMVPLGANFEVDPGYDPAAREAVPDLKLLFVGGDWERKGGPLLLEMFEILRARFPGAELHIVGCEPESAKGIEDVTVHGYLNKSDSKDAAKLEGLFRQAAFLVVPSRQEAFGIAFCEACAYGLPPVGTKTGGIKSIIRDGENGLLLEPEASAEAQAERIAALWSDRDAYLAMCATARRHYENRLSWGAWAAQIEAEAERLLAD
ncbi:glycosyltransferase family 4 protein [Vannielia litorea]|uniref:glycosyltransferase family 4 protein n=1 Tax=Vannielia litorea TaxID=1217970 RepID=UPI001C94A7AE|nr:glycosyltransferase family 4 protein [Vannielia litorea]MBY6049546.1 glycosyltransferase family 4 protein [Vannielia litorea]MBY6076960.1 glycosyltransferase family 4 protein [Vannielia litorea]